MLICDHHVNWKDFKINGRKSNKFILELKENLFIKRDEPILNKNQFFQELLLF